MSSAIKLTAVLTAAVLGAACTASTKVTQEWKDPSAAAPPMRNVVVLVEGVTPATRHAVEDRFVASLAEHGVRATPSYQAMGETLPPQSDAARVALRNSGYDGALVVHVGRGETRYVQTTSPPSYYAYGAPMPATPETVSQTTVTSQAALWDLAGAKPVWHATATTTEPDSGKEIAKSLTKKVVPEMANDGVIPNKSD